MQLNIISDCIINQEKVICNGQELVCRTPENEDWLTTIYRAIGMQYPKFFKMDRLCKAGTLAAELLLKDIDFNREEVKDDWGIVLINSASSLDDDRHYQTTIQDSENYYPSPAVFVYTLANIVTGEIAIRHKIGGESSFYVLPQYDEAKIQELAMQTFSANPELTHLICGWVDYDNSGCDVKIQLLAR